MPVFSYPHFPASVLPKALRLGLLALTSAALVACGSFDSGSNRIASVITPYRMEVVQGNFVAKEQVEALRPGMSRAQVKEILGTPLVTSAFHADRWDYVFTIRRQGIEAQTRKFAVFFKGDDFDKVEGDTLPSEAEFVATLDTQRRLGKVPALAATQEQLDKAQAKQGNAASVPAAAVAPSGTVYPPLEPAR